MYLFANSSTVTSIDLLTYILAAVTDCSGERFVLFRHYSPQNRLGYVLLTSHSSVLKSLLYISI